MKEILLNKEKVAFVDDEDYELLNSFKWRYDNGYACRTSYLNGKKNIKMHRLVMKCPDNMEVDHIFGNGLDNQKKNLRICTPKQNSYNQKKAINNKSGYKGVSWHKPLCKWRAQIFINKKHISLGLFIKKEDAALAYNTAAIKYHGEFARLNIIK